MSNNKEETYEACKEIVTIFKENYVNSPQFRTELISALNRKTGNNRLGMLCDNVISELHSGK
jgi:methyltransferase-like protein